MKKESRLQGFKDDSEPTPSKVVEKDNRTLYQKEKDQERLQQAAFARRMDAAAQKLALLREMRRSQGEPEPRIPE